MTVSADQSNSPSTEDDPQVIARVYGQTDVGRTREHNEDTFVVADLNSGEVLQFENGPLDVVANRRGLLFMVADGMGGAASGELASGMAVEVVLEMLRAEWGRVENPSVEHFAIALRNATTAANSRIHGFASEHPEHRGMGTTATIAGLFGDRLYVAQVGDSRAYLLRNGITQQLTKDQSLMQRLIEAGEMTPEQAEASERRNIILQALGPEPHVTIDLTHQQVRRGDLLVLCSDGLSGLVRGDEYADVASTVQNVQGMCQQLIHRANERGGPDNITVIAVHFDGTALEPHQDGDQVGYSTYLLEGTLNSDASDTPAPPRNLKARLRSDPTPRMGTPAPDFFALEEEIREANEAKRARLSTPATLGAPDIVVAERRRKVEPVYFLLATVAIAAVAWLAYGLFAAG